MATAPRLLWQSSCGTDITTTPVALATAIAKYDFISVESNLAVLMDAVTEDATFGGLSNDVHVASDANQKLTIVLLMKCVATVDCTSDTYILGAPVMYTSANAVVDATSATTLGWTHKYSGSSAVTRLDVLFDVPLLQKLFALT